MRKTINLPCPGSASNFVVIVATAWQSKYGLGNPKNVGNCELFISPLDENGKPIEGGHRNVQLSPGKSMAWYYPPEGTAQIVAVCSKVCHGRAILEIDLPAS